MLVGGRWRFIKRFWIIDRWTWLWTLLVERCERQDMTKVKNQVDVVDTLSLSLSRSPQHERNSSFSLDVGMSHCLLAGQRKSDRFLLQFSAKPNQLIFFQEKWTSFIIDGSYRFRREMLLKIVQLSDIKSNFQMEPLKRLQSTWRMVRCTTVAATRQILLYLNIFYFSNYVEW